MKLCFGFGFGFEPIYDKLNFNLAHLKKYIFKFLNKFGQSRVYESESKINEIFHG